MTVTRDNLASYLDRLDALIQPAIVELLGDGVDSRNHEAVFYQSLAGGKRLRPALAVMSCELLGGELEDVLYPAAALEILHNCTLIIDDIIDHSDFRRNRPTVWKKYGKSIAKCISMSYASSIFQGAARTRKGALLTEHFARTLKSVVDGEILDILFERSGRDDEPFVENNRYETVTREDYINMIRHKTATLIKASCEVGGLCAGGSNKDLEALGEYGFNIGMAFQIRDDILDIFGDEKEFGKKIGKDIFEKKMGNIVIIFALEELGSRTDNLLVKILETERPVTDEGVREAIGLISGTAAQAKAFELCRSYIDESLSVLEQLPQNQAGELLRDMANFIFSRNN